jgi:hypothetical protein
MKCIKREAIKYFLAAICLLLVMQQGLAQQVWYSEPDKSETRQTNFDIIGRYDDKVLIFKNNRNSNYISVYNDEMQLVSNVDLDFIPNKIIEYDILPFNNFSYLFYQYQQRNIAYLMAVKIGPDGKPLTTPFELDTTTINYNASNRVYSVLASEDKTKLMAFKINSKNDQLLLFETNLYDENLGAINASTLQLPMNDRFDFLTDFFLDNDGNLVFGKGRRKSSEDNINQFYLISKPPKADSFVLRELKFEGIMLDEVKLRIDNYNKRYLFTAFYYKGRRTSNIEGVANSLFDAEKKQWMVQNVIPLSDELRADARTDNNIKSAFNDYYIKQIFIRKDGGFVMNAESVYTTSRGGGGFNRWDMFGNQGMMGSPMGWGGWGMMGPGGFGSPFGRGFSNVTRFHADNIIVLVFNAEGQLSISNVIRKSQFDDESDAMVSYQTINSGSAIHYLYNNYERRDVVLSFQSLNSDGKVIRNPTMKGLDMKYEFMPRFARQIAARTVIVPCFTRNQLCFARVDIY